eukprot:3104807-Alexandrium_andersonii.AAC.1
MCASGLAVGLWTLHAVLKDGARGRHLACTERQGEKDITHGKKGRRRERGPNETPCAAKSGARIQNIHIYTYIVHGAINIEPAPNT